MFPDNTTPEQRAKFMTSSGDYLPDTHRFSKFRHWKPAAFGIISAALIFGFTIWHLSPGKDLPLLSPFVVDKGDNTNKPVGPTEMNPLTGELIAEADAQLWKDSRPIGVMINNHDSARPQSGLAEADLVYEIVAEGGITRYLSFFLSSLPEKIGPVRSTREYYLVLVKELGDAMIMHIGYSPQALEAIQTWPVRSLARGGAEFWRDQSRIDNGIPVEHTAYVNGQYLRTLGNSLGWEGEREFSPWQFKEDSPSSPDENGCFIGSCSPITIDFWYSGDYSAIFKYDQVTNSYLKYTGYDSNGEPIPTVDQETDKQVNPKNLIVQFVTETPIAGDDKSRLEYRLVGSGQGLVFIDGKVISAVWKKEGRDLRTVFYDTNGQEIVFNRGKIWISIVPDRNIEQVTY